jgi:hypothetical protein
MLARSRSSQDLLKIFLANNGMKLLDRKQRKIARMIVGGMRPSEIATSLSSNRGDISRNARRIRRIAIREAAKRARLVEQEVLIVKLRATGKPNTEFPIDDLLSLRLEKMLRGAGIRTLGDIARLGHTHLVRTVGAKKADVAEVSCILKLAGLELHARPPHQDSIMDQT